MTASFTSSFAQKEAAAFVVEPVVVPFFRSQVGYVIFHASNDLFELYGIIALRIFVVNRFREISAICTTNAHSRYVRLSFSQSVVPFAPEHPHGAFFPEKDGKKRHENER